MASATEFLEAGQEGFEKRDSSGVEKFITDDFQMISPITTRSRQEFLDWVSGGGNAATVTAVFDVEVLYENDEVAVVYAVVMTLVASKKSNLKFEKLIIDVIDNANESGINSIDNYFINQNMDLKQIKLKLDYENSRKISYVHRIFNQLFYGPVLYEEIFNEKSQFSEKPLIDLDDIVLDDNLMSKLKTRFGNKISTVTGRGNFAFSYSMKNFLNNFDMKNSVFLDDRPLNLAKPNPKSLIESISGINSKCSLYIGDSMEDLLMVEKCKEHGHDVSFCGIYGSSDEPELKYELFQKNKASFILESIQELPKALNLV